MTEPEPIKDDRPGSNDSAKAYEVGQVWKYHSRDYESGSHLYIVRIDEHEDYGEIFHIVIDRIALKNPFIEGGVQDVLPHAPVSRRALDESVTNLLGISNQLPDITEEYLVWRKDFDKGEGGVFEISAAEIITCIEDVAARNA